jgi:hypothetical protein
MKLSYAVALPDCGRQEHHGALAADGRDLLRADGLGPPDGAATAGNPRATRAARLDPGSLTPCPKSP